MATTEGFILEPTSVTKKEGLDEYLASKQIDPSVRTEIHEKLAEPQTVKEVPEENDHLDTSNSRISNDESLTEVAGVFKLANGEEMKDDNKAHQEEDLGDKNNGVVDRTVRTESGQNDLVGKNLEIAEEGSVELQMHLKEAGMMNKETEATPVHAPEIPEKPVDVNQISIIGEQEKGAVQTQKIETVENGKDEELLIDNAAENSIPSVAECQESKNQEDEMNENGNTEKIYEESKTADKEDYTEKQIIEESINTDASSVQVEEKEAKSHEEIVVIPEKSKQDEASKQVGGEPDASSINKDTELDEGQCDIPIETVEQSSAEKVEQDTGEKVVTNETVDDKTEHTVSQVSSEEKLPKEIVQDNSPEVSEGDKKEVTSPGEEAGINESESVVYTTGRGENVLNGKRNVHSNNEESSHLVLEEEDVEPPGSEEMKTGAPNVLLKEDDQEKTTEFLEDSEQKIQLDITNEETTEKNEPTCEEKSKKTEISEAMVDVKQISSSEEQEICAVQAQQIETVENGKDEELLIDNAAENSIPSIAECQESKNQEDGINENGNTEMIYEESKTADKEEDTEKQIIEERTNTDASPAQVEEKPAESYEGKMNDPPIVIKEEIVKVPEKSEQDEASRQVGGEPEASSINKDTELDECPSDVSVETVEQSPVETVEQLNCKEVEEVVEPPAIEEMKTQAQNVLLKPDKASNFEENQEQSTEFIEDSEQGIQLNKTNDETTEKIEAASEENSKLEGEKEIEKEQEENESIKAVILSDQVQEESGKEHATDHIKEQVIEEDNGPERADKDDGRQDDSEAMNTAETKRPEEEQPRDLEASDKEMATADQIPQEEQSEIVTSEAGSTTTYDKVVETPVLAETMIRENGESGEQVQTTSAKLLFEVQEEALTTEMQESKPNQSEAAKTESQEGSDTTKMTREALGEEFQTPLSAVSLEIQAQDIPTEAKTMEEDGGKEGEEVEDATEQSPKVSEPKDIKAFEISQKDTTDQTELEELQVLSAEESELIITSTAEKKEEKISLEEEMNHDPKASDEKIQKEQDKGVEEAKVEFPAGTEGSHSTEPENIDEQKQAAELKEDETQEELQDPTITELTETEATQNDVVHLLDTREQSLSSELASDAEDKKTFETNGKIDEEETEKNEGFTALESTESLINPSKEALDKEAALAYKEEKQECRCDEHERAITNETKEKEPKELEISKEEQLESSDTTKTTELLTDQILPQETVEEINIPSSVLSLVDQVEETSTEAKKTEEEGTKEGKVVEDLTEERVEASETAENTPLVEETSTEAKKTEEEGTKEGKVVEDITEERVEASEIAENTPLVEEEPRNLVTSEQCQKITDQTPPDEQIQLSKHGNAENQITEQETVKISEGVMQNTDVSIKEEINDISEESAQNEMSNQASEELERSSSERVTDELIISQSDVAFEMVEKSTGEETSARSVSKQQNDRIDESSEDPNTSKTAETPPDQNLAEDKLEEQIPSQSSELSLEKYVLKTPTELMNIQDETDEREEAESEQHDGNVLVQDIVNTAEPAVIPNLPEEKPDEQIQPLEPLPSSAKERVLETQTEAEKIDERITEVDLAELETQDCPKEAEKETNDAFSTKKQKITEEEIYTENNQDPEVESIEKIVEPLTQREHHIAEPAIESEEIEIQEKQNVEAIAETDEDAVVKTTKVACLEGEQNQEPESYQEAESSADQNLPTEEVRLLKKQTEEKTLELETSIEIFSSDQSLTEERINKQTHIESSVLPSVEDTTNVKELSKKDEDPSEQTSLADKLPEQLQITQREDQIAENSSTSKETEETFSQEREQYQANGPDNGKEIKPAETTAVMEVLENEYANKELKEERSDQISIHDDTSNVEDIKMGTSPIIAREAPKEELSDVNEEVKAEKKIEEPLLLPVTMLDTVEQDLKTEGISANTAIKEEVEGEKAVSVKLEKQVPVENDPKVKPENIVEISKKNEEVEESENVERPLPEVKTQEHDVDKPTMEISTRNSLSDLLVKAKANISQESDEYEKEKKETAAGKGGIDTEEAKTRDFEGTERADEEEAKIEEGGEEQADEHKEDIVIVESKDSNNKTPHKKSHNILSGVGSKVKHSISKVKKAITGKSSNPKPVSPK